MTPHENLMAVLRGGDPEWMPACVHIANANNLPGFLPKALLAEPLDRLRIAEFVGGDILHEVHGVRIRLPAGVGIRNTHDGDTCKSVLTTPIGSLTQRLLSAHIASPSYDDLPEGYAVPGPIVNSVRTTHFVAEPGDYRILRSYFEAQTFHADCGRIADEKNRVGEKGVLVLGGGPSSPLYSLASSYAGIERLSYDLFDAPDEVISAMDAMTAAGCRWYEAAAASPCGVIRCTEDLDTKLISPEMFRQYAVPALRHYARICHEQGKLFVIHMCGHIRDFLPDLRAVGADAIHCLATPPTGNTVLGEARGVLAGHVAAMIRVDPELLLRGDEECLSAFVGRIQEETGDWRHVLMIIPCGRASLWSIRHVIAQVHARGKWC